MAEVVVLFFVGEIFLFDLLSNGHLSEIGILRFSHLTREENQNHTDANTSAVLYSAIMLNIKPSSPRQGGFYHQVEPEGFEPSSKHGTICLSTYIVQY